MAKLGEKFYDRYSDEAVTCIYKKDTDSILEGYEEAMLEYFEKFDREDSPDLFLDCYNDVVDASIFEDEDYPLVSEFVIAESIKKAEYIKALLKEVEGLDFNNLILSDGRLYNGPDECEDYIQGTHAWCSSSMMC